MLTRPEAHLRLGEVRCGGGGPCMPVLRWKRMLIQAFAADADKRRVFVCMASLGAAERELLCEKPL